MRYLLFCQYWVWIFLLAACGGSSSNSLISNISSNSSEIASVKLSGVVTYDFIPAHESHIGLNYEASQIRPVRGAVVELLDADGRILAESLTDINGGYDFQVAPDTQVRVRVKAQLKQARLPSWNVKVTDNTRNNRMYALDGGLVSSGGQDSFRNLHAASGWANGAYSSPRAAGPFAILDAVYLGLQGIIEVNSDVSFPPLELRWSVNNTTAVHPEGDFSTGEIGTSAFVGDVIYLLGAENVDTDEFDTHVILHEWAHYFEKALSRTDTIGGMHQYADYLDMRVALSEGFSNALSAMLLNDEHYRDSGGAQQRRGYTFDVSETNHPVKGWYNESSIESIFFNYYRSDNGKAADDFASLISVLMDASYISAQSLTSIFLFAERWKALFPEQVNLIESLLVQQDINAFDQYALTEINDAGYAGLLPVYKTLYADGIPVSACSTARFGKGNKVGVYQFFRLQITRAGQYTLAASRNSGDLIDTNPDFKVYRRGTEVSKSASETLNQEIKTIYLTPDEYILELYDRNNTDPTHQGVHTTCFSVQVN